MVGTSMAEDANAIVRLIATKLGRGIGVEV